MTPLDSRRKRSRVNRRREIMRIAAKLFADKGYSAASLDEVAAQLDLTKAALYHHIQNKEEILKEICEGVLHHGMRDWKRINESNLSPRDKLRWFIREVVKGSTEGKDVMAVLFENSNSLSPALRMEVNKQRKAFDKALEDLLNEGVDKGYFNLHDVKVAIFLIQGTCNWAYQWYRPNGRLSPEEIAEETILLLENGYLK